jgi:ABC-type branched-subunit amino acid transport system substrate-binding protein
MIRRLAFSSFIFQFSFFLLIGTARTARAADDLVLGMSAAFTGSSRGLGIELYRGATAYFDEVNKAGGVNGQKIVLKVYDDGYNPGPAVENTIKLIEKDNVLLLFGYVGTPTTSRVLPLLKRYRERDALMFFPFTGAAAVRTSPYVFNLRASYAQETGELVDHFVKLGRKKIAVFYQVDAYGRSGWEGVRTALKRHKLEIAEEATYMRGAPYDKSMREQVDILRQAEPDAVICIGAYGACAAFIRDARDAGWYVPIANVSFVGSESLLNLLTDAGNGNGVDYTRNLINSQVVPSYYDKNLPAVRDYRTAMDEMDPKPPPGMNTADYRSPRYSFVSLEGYLDAKLMVEILKRAEAPVRRDKLVDAVKSVRDFDLGIGVPVSFMRKGEFTHQALDKVYFTVVRDGRFVPLDEEGWKEFGR